jgi:hypothetical protein
MSNKSDNEKGTKWWVRYVVVPVVVALIGVIIVLRRNPTPPQPNLTTKLCTITNLNWNTYQEDKKGSLITVKPVAETNCAINISFDLKKDGWATIYKKLTPQSLLQAKGIRFFYRGTGVPNTIELKLIDRNETIFEAIWYNATDTTGQRRTWEALFTDFRCRKGAGKCMDDGAVSSLTFNPLEIDRIDIAFSNKSDHGDVPGSGEITIEEIEVIP